ncbi:MAG: FAD-dependent monooxygenase [Paracoccaceae bacterium]|nr:FAD-dependent monooxygenase [Paracoccaceae bacterium]
MERSDVFISGAGIAGLTAAAVLARRGLSVTIADPAPPEGSASDPGADLRSTAFLQPARALFEEAGLWAALAPEATALQTLRVIDTAGDPPQARTVRSFEAAEISDAPFGWNLPNWLTRKVLTEALAVTPGVDLRLGTAFESILTREREARIRLTDGTRLIARLAIAADGRASPLRAGLGIGTTTTRYGQKALAFSVTHEVPHENVSTELYHRGGAFVLVPLPDHDGKPASAVVWMQDGRDALETAALSGGDFDARATERSTGVLGHLTRIGGLRIWPVITQTADEIVAERVAILAEAAHVMPPIGAQGLNTSLNDVASLVAAIDARPGDPGAREVLDRFARDRERDIRVRASVIDFYNRLCRSGDAPVQALRSAGLKLVHDIAPLRRAVMTAGLGG